MECPNVLMSLWFLLYGSDEACLKSPANLALLSMFVLHYVNRYSTLARHAVRVYRSRLCFFGARMVALFLELDTPAARPFVVIV